MPANKLPKAKRVARLKEARFLFFLYHYPPSYGTASNRNFLISSQIRKRVSFAKTFTVVKSKTQQDAQEEENVQLIEAFDYRKILRRRAKDGALPESKKRSPWMQSIIKLINTFPFNIIVGEGGILYFFRLIRKGQRVINEESVTHLYSSYRPFTDHYAAYVLKKRNPQIFWIADFRDLVIDPHYNHILFPGMQQMMFKRIFKNANLLTTVSEGLAKHLEAYNSNVLTLRNGISQMPGEMIPVHSKYFKLAYTGSMFLDKRNAEPLFIAVRELLNEGKLVDDDVRIIYAGKDEIIWQTLALKYKLETVLDTRGIVSPTEAKFIQANACINILLTISSEQLYGVLTGKMIEYFEAGNPVMAIIVNQNDPELEKILAELEIGKSFSDQQKDLGAIKEFIHAEYIFWKRMGTNRKAVNMDVLEKKYAVEHTMQPFLERIVYH